jgi:hypothetical protein
MLILHSQLAGSMRITVCWDVMLCNLVKKCTDVWDDPTVPIVRIHGIACSVLPKHAASHSRRWHPLWLILWEQVSLQWCIFSHLHIANPCSYGLSVILALCGELALEESTDLSCDRLWNEWMFIWSQIFVNIWLFWLLLFVFLFNCICTLCTVPVTILTIPRVKWCLPQTVWTGPATLLKELVRCFVCQERELKITLPQCDILGCLCLVPHSALHHNNYSVLETFSVSVPWCYQRVLFGRPR